MVPEMKAFHNLQTMTQISQNGLFLANYIQKIPVPRTWLVGMVKSLNHDMRRNHQTSGFDVSDVNRQFSWVFVVFAAFGVYFGFFGVCGHLRETGCYRETTGIRLRENCGDKHDLATKGPRERERKRWTWMNKWRKVGDSDERKYDLVHKIEQKTVRSAK